MTGARLDAGPVEYRLERRGEATVVLFHGGHMRADLALGEEVGSVAAFWSPHALPSRAAIT